jgi:hypothetical protein
MTHTSSPPSLLGFVRRHPASFAFGVVLAGTLTVGLLQGERIFYGDSGGYWSLAESFTREGHFSLLNFENPLRGYALPLVNYVLSEIGEGLHWTPSRMATLLNVLLYALIGAVLAPALAECAWPQRRWGFGRRLLLTALLLISWSGDLSYPLTDFPGLTMALLALVAIARSEHPGWMLLAGAAGGLAIDLRPAFLPLLPMLLVIVGLTWRAQRHTPHPGVAWRGLCVTALVLGMVAVSLPQSLAAHRHFGTWSPIPSATENLGPLKLTRGMYLQRFDSYEGPGGPAELAYVDPTGKRLLEQQPASTIKDSSQYLRLIVSHPFLMAKLAARHIVNGLDTRYSTVYVEHLDSGGHLWLRLLGFLLDFLALVRLLWSAARRSLGPIRWRYPIALLLCCLTSVPTEMETRYMLPVYLLGYMLVLAPGWPKPIAARQAGLQRFRTPVTIAVTYLAFMLVIWHVVSAAKGQLMYP